MPPRALSENCLSVSREGNVIHGSMHCACHSVLQARWWLRCKICSWSPAARCCLSSSAWASMSRSAPDPRPRRFDSCSLAFVRVPAYWGISALPFFSVLAVMVLCCVRSRPCSLNLYLAQVVQWFNLTISSAEGATLVVPLPIRTAPFKPFLEFSHTTVAIHINILARLLITRDPFVVVFAAAGRLPAGQSDHCSVHGYQWRQPRS